MTHEQLLKLHGVEITFMYQGQYVEDAKICVEDGRVYVCCNIRYMYGSRPKDKLGYVSNRCISTLERPYDKNKYVAITNIKLKMPNTGFSLQNLMDGLDVNDISLDLENSHSNGFRDLTKSFVDNPIESKQEETFTDKLMKLYKGE